MTSERSSEDEAGEFCLIIGVGDGAPAEDVAGDGCLSIGVGGGGAVPAAGRCVKATGGLKAVGLETGGLKAEGLEGTVPPVGSEEPETRTYRATGDGTN